MSEHTEVTAFEIETLRLLMSAYEAWAKSDSALLESAMREIGNWLGMEG